MLYEEKTPYLLTILFVALGWTISQITTDLTKSPILEYKQCKKVMANKTKHAIAITNISLEKVFSNLIFKLRPEAGSGVICLDSPEMIAPPPTELKSPTQQKEGEGFQEPECINGEYAEYSLPKLQPGATIQIVMNTDKDVDVNLYVWSENSVRLVESSFLTWAAKNRFGLLICLICVWALLIIIYLILIHKNPCNNQENEGEKG